MFTSNWTLLHPSKFLLMGIPGLQHAHLWISIPFCCIYMVTIFGNFLLLGVIKTEPSLHEPMYLFLSMLAGADLVVTTTTVPKALRIFWFENEDIHINGCLMQLFFLHAFSTMESGFILAMAFDRYMAICKPLRHSAVLTKDVIAKIGLAVVLRGILLFSPHPLLLKWLPYCKGNIIFHTYCEFMCLVKPACVDTTVQRYFGLIVACLMGGLDLILIILSYICILQAVFKLPTKEAQAKSLGICSSHAGAILVSYFPAFFSILTHRFGHSVSPCVHIIIANIYVLLPPMANPIIYGVRTKKIREGALKILSRSSLPIQKAESSKREKCWDAAPAPVPDHSA
ncbi:olfactory receptor 52K2-like [Eublepharis macularius]|uniref:Olfactory receptor n=1 Tax=Eublepharis macularius TaxID=481883 RepID=A0AA97KTM3_EUBMA|nr:olfactory receptor 52K2-like [Eublepharis macularius]